jgi:penicillin-binding protein 1A
LALGGSEVTPLELATGFSVFANEGKEVIPLPIRFVNNRDGRQVSNTEYEVRRLLAMKEKHGTRRILPKPLNWIMVDLMRYVVRRGTATRVRTKGGFTRPVAGKTGTTSNWADGWFGGYTPRLATVIWTGYDERSFSLGPAGSGGNSVAPVFGSYMSDVLGDKKPLRFPRKPRGVKQGGFCTICNGWPTKHCPKNRRTGGYFLEGFGAPGCPQEEWQHYEYSSVNERYQELHGLSDKEIRKRLMQKMLGQKEGQDGKDKKKQDGS